MAFLFLIDTAGLRESRDIIETIGVEKSMEKMKEADLVLYLFDVVEETRNELEAAQLMIQQHNPNYLLVGNKTDILGKQEAENKFSGDDILFISGTIIPSYRCIKRSVG